jgi:cytidylate kinase
MIDVVAIDGPAGSGKSTVARALATRLNWQYLDTGAMYRAIAVIARRRGLDITNEEAMVSLGQSVALTLASRVIVDGCDVTDELRSPETNRDVSVVAAIAGVRSSMVQRQRDYVKQSVGGVVVEGRDITTVVFPDARLKIFLTATLEERVRRRGEEDASSVSRRDHVDSSRSTSPLRQADDAVVVDTTGKSVAEVVDEIVGLL